MYHTFYFFQRLSLQLGPILRNTRLLECFSQQKDEIVFRFYSEEGRNVFIKADLSQGNCLLTFPQDFARTRSNSVDLFPELYGSPVDSVRQSPNDRSFHIAFLNGLQICFKMYGGRSNLLIHNGSEVSNVFNHHLKKDLENGVPQGRQIPESETGFCPDPEILRKRYPTFSKRIWQYWEEMSRSKPNDEQAVLFQDLMLLLETGPMILCRQNDVVFLSFVPIGTVLEESNDALFISNRLSQYFWQVNQFFKQKNRLLAILQQKMFFARTQMEAAEKQWLEAEESKSYRLQADLLMAYGHSVPKGAQSVELPDFSGSGTVEIRLKKDLSVIENAERFYRKSKGQQQDAQRLEARIESWKETLNSNTNQHNALTAVENWVGLKPFLQASALDNEEKEILPYHAHRFLDYDIWVGKSAKANDELLRLAHKDDLWLHARDVAGSHVVIRTKKGKTTPAPVVERAAAWAAYYSKGKSEGLCPVMVTERKYVRKGKHMLPGQVRVEKEKTILVEPKE